MASPADFQRINILIAEAITLCAAAQERVRKIHEELMKGIEKAIDEGGPLADDIFEAETEARRVLFDSRTRLSIMLAHERSLRQLTKHGLTKHGE